MSVFITSKETLSKVGKFKSYLLKYLDDWKCNVIYYHKEITVDLSREPKENVEQEPYYRSINKNNITPPDWYWRRKMILKRDNYICALCGTGLTDNTEDDADHAHIHHIVKRSDGGGHEFNNLVALCNVCHATLEGHEKVLGPSFIVNDKTLMVHSAHCFSIRGKGLRATRKWPNGYRGCNKCMPWGIQKERWESNKKEHEKKILSYMQLCYSFLAPQVLLKEKPSIKLI